MANTYLNSIAISGLKDYPGDHVLWFELGEGKEANKRRVSLNKSFGLPPKDPFPLHFCAILDNGEYDAFTFVKQLKETLECLDVGEGLNKNVRIVIRFTHEGHEYAYEKSFKKGEVKSEALFDAETVEETIVWEKGQSVEDCLALLELQVLIDGGFPYRTKNVSKKFLELLGIRHLSKDDPRVDTLKNIERILDSDDKFFIEPFLFEGLHPRQILACLEVFRDQNKQVVFATNHTSCLSALNNHSWRSLLLEECYLIERNRDKNVSIFSVAEFEHKDVFSVEKAYMQGRLGGLPFTNTYLYNED